LAGVEQYSLECEPLVPRDKEAHAHEEIISWTRAYLPVSEFTEAPSMLELLLASA